MKEDNYSFDNTESYEASHVKPSRGAMAKHANFDNAKTSRGKP